MSDKMKYVKIKRENGTYTDAIPVAVDAANVQFPDGRTLIQATQDFINGTDIAVKFNPTEVYNPGDYIYNNQNLYRVLVKHNANVSWDSWYSVTNAEQIILTDEIKNMIYIGTSQPSNPANKVWINSGLTSTIQIPTELEFEDLRDSVAEQYSTKTYLKGEYCINDNKLYRCKADIATAEATFIPSHWQLVNVGDEIYDLKEDMEDEFVRFDVAQNLTAAQKQQARDNIGGASVEQVSDLKDDFDQVKDVVGIPNLATKSISIQGQTSVNQQQTEMLFAANSGDTIIVEVTGTAVQSSTNKTLYLFYSDNTSETITNTSFDEGKLIKQLSKELVKISFYIVNLIDGTLNLEAKTNPETGLAPDVNKLKNELSDKIDNIIEVIGIPSTVTKTINVSGSSVNQQNTETPFTVSEGKTININLSGSAIQSSTNSTLYFQYSDDTSESVNITSAGHKYTKTLQKDLLKLSFYIINLTSGSLVIYAEEDIKTGLIIDVSNLQKEKAEIGIKEISGSNVQRAEGRINGNTGEAVDPSYFSHAIINVAEFTSVEFISAPQGLSSTFGYAFFNENDEYISGSGITDTDIKMSIDIPENAVIFKYGFYNPLWSDSKYTSFTLKNSNNTIIGLQEQINFITGTDSKVVCFGDSMTQGNQDATGNTYPKYLSMLLGKSVYNAGVGGEDTLQIASRQGGIHLMVEPFTIPATTDAVSVTLSCLEHDYTDPFYIISQANGGINPVEIAGVIGTLTFTGNWATQTYTYTFARNTAGDAVTLTRPEPVITYTSKMRDYIQIFWVGTNDAPHSLDTVKDKIVPRIDAMIEWTNAKNYLVIGLTAKNRFSDLVDCNTYMQRHFGTRFIDISKYILQYGLQDESITPTSQDTTDITNGEIPSSLRVDTVHMNKNGYHIVANQVYKRGQLLGYWS